MIRMKPQYQRLSVLVLVAFCTPTFAGSYYIDRDSCSEAQIEFVRTAMTSAFDVSRPWTFDLTFFALKKS